MMLTSAIKQKSVRFLLPVAAMLAAPTLTGGALLGAPSVAAAQEDAASSELTGIRLPKGAARLDRMAGSFARLLGSVAGEEGVRLASPGREAEVVVWSGSAYKPGRGGFTRTGVRNALDEAGYACEDVSEHKIRDTNPFDERFGLREENGAFRLEIQDRISYFTAANAGKRQTLVGVWIEGPDHLALALLPVGFKAEAKNAPPPAVSGADVLMVKDINDAMKGVAPPPTPAFPKMARKPGTVRGMVKDPAGRPVAGAQIIAWASAAGGFRTDSRARTNAQGVYEVVLPVGVCQVVNADCRVRYNEKTYLLPLHPVDGERDHFNSKDGHIEHFVLRTWGAAGPNAEQSPQFGSNYYGGHIRLLEYVDEGGTFEVTLEPQGPLLGGVKGRTLVFRFPNKGGSEVFLNDIPIGRYLLRARLLDGGEALPLRVKMTFGESTPAASLQVDFEAENGDLASLERSGIKRFDISLEP